MVDTPTNSGVRDFIQQLEESFPGGGFTLLHREWCENTRSSFGLYTLGTPSHAGKPYEAQLGLKIFKYEENDQISFNSVFGEHVFVCDNNGLRSYGATTETLSRVNPVKSDVDRFIEECGKVFALRTQLFDRLQEKKLPDSKAMEILARAAFDPYKKQIVKQEWHNPSFPDFLPRNAWSLYNDFTHAAKAPHYYDVMEGMEGVEPLFEELVTK